MAERFKTLEIDPSNENLNLEILGKLKEIMVRLETLETSFHNMLGYTRLEKGDSSDQHPIRIKSRILSLNELRLHLERKSLEASKLKHSLEGINNEKSK